MNGEALKAGILAMLSQAGTLAVAYGLVDNVRASLWIALTGGLVNSVFLITAAWHAQTNVKAQAVQALTPRAPVLAQPATDSGTTGTPVGHPAAPAAA